MARNILLRLTGDSDDAKAAMDEVVEKIKSFGKEEATAEIRVDADQAKREIDETFLELKSLPKEQTIRIRVAGEAAKLEALEARLASLRSSASATDAAGGDTSAAVRQMGNLANQISVSRSRLESLSSDFDRLGQKGTSNFDKVTGAVVRMTAGLGKAGKALEHVPLLGGAAGGAVGGASGVASGIARFLMALSQMLPEAAQGMAGLVSAGVGLAAMGAALAAIAGLIAAIVVSLGEALIGVAALGVAFLAALGPIGLLLALVATKIKDIIGAQQTLKTAAQNVKSAIEGQKEAVTELHQAEQNESTQRIQAIGAQISAINALHDAENQLADSRLGIQSAAQQLQQARLTLASFKLELAGLGTAPSSLSAASTNVSVGGNLGQQQSGSNKLAFQEMLLQYKEDILGVKTALQQQRDATQAVRDAQTQQSQAQQTVDMYQQRGLRAYPAYQQAVNSVATATENLARAQDQVSASQLAQRQALKHGASEAAGFLAVWDKLKVTLHAIFGPAEAAIFKGIEESLLIMAKGLKPLEPAFLDLGKAIGGAFVWWAKMMTKPGNMALLAKLIRDAAGETEKMSRWLGSVFKLIVQVATDAMPTLLRLIGHWSSELAHVAGNHKTISHFIQMCISQTKLWWDRIKGVLGFVVTLAGVMKPLLSVVEGIAAAFESIGKALGIGKSGGLLAGLALLMAAKGGGSGLLGGLGGLLGGGLAKTGSSLFGKGGGLIGDAGAVGVAGAAGYGIGTLLNNQFHLSNSIDSLLGIGGPSDVGALKQNTAINSKLTQANIAKQLSILMSGVWNGRAVTAAIRQQLVAMMGSEGFGSAKLAAAGFSSKGAPIVQNHTHVWHMNQGATVGDPQHFAAVVQRKLNGRAY